MTCASRHLRGAASHVSVASEKAACVACRHGAVVKTNLPAIGDPIMGEDLGIDFESAEYSYAVTEADCELTPEPAVEVDHE